jgi:DNA-binding CsgD family transcriptional regulator
MRRNGAILKNRSACVVGLVMETEENKMTLTNLSPRLTAAEKRVLALVSAAKTNKEIAFALGISPATVKRHLENVLRKLALRNRVEAAIYGLIANGCPSGLSSACPLALWRKAKHDADPKMGRLTHRRL